MTTTRFQHSRDRHVLPFVGQHAWVVLLASSLILNVVLSERVRAYHRVQAATGTVREGTALPALDVVATSTGRHLRLEYGADALPTVLYYFSPVCGWCERNWRNVAAVERQTQGRFRFLAVSTTPDVQRIRAAHAIGFEIYSGLSEEARRAHGFIGTPHTIVLSPEGQVLKAWAGAYNERVGREIAAYLQVSLPGLTPRT